jgi:hypothetical protein
MEFDRETLQMIPESIKGENRKDAARLLTQKRILQEQNKTIDKALQGDNNRKIKEIDNTLEALVDGEQGETTTKTAEQETTEETMPMQEVSVQEEVKEEAIQEASKPKLELKPPTKLEVRKAKSPEKMEMASQQAQEIKTEITELRKVLNCLWS